MAVVYSNNASTALTSGITNSETSITVGSVAGFPALTGSDYYYATLANVTNTKIEIVKVTAAAGTTLTVVRGQDNTTAVSFDASDNLQLRVTAATLESATSTDVVITGGSVSTSTITDATASAKGLATAAQITKLDAIEASADVTDTTNVVAALSAGTGVTISGAGVVTVTHDGLSDFVANEHIDWTTDQGATNIHAGNYTDTNTTYSVGDGGLTEINFTSADNSKLDGIATGADVTSANETSHADVLVDGDVGVSVQAYDADTAKLDAIQNYTLPQRSADTVDNDGSFNLNLAQNFTCTPSSNITLTFTNIPDGQSGTIVLINTGGHTITAASTTKVMGDALLDTVTEAGTYVIGYISDGSNVRIYNSAAQQ